MSTPGREQVRRRAPLAGWLLLAVLLVAAGAWAESYLNGLRVEQQAREAQRAAAERAEREAHEARMRSERQAREAIAEGNRRQEEDRRK